MPDFLKLHRLNRRLFFLVSGILWAVFWMAIIAVLVAQASNFNPSIPAIMKLIANIVSLKYYALALVVISAVIFSYAYLGRFIDGDISPWFAVVPLAVFYGLLTWVMIDFILLWQQSNLLLFIAKLKRFLETPTLAYFQGLFAPEWISFVAEKKWLLDIAIVLYFFILVAALLIPSQQDHNRYGPPRKLSWGMQILALLLTLFFIGVTAINLYLGGYFLSVESPASYLTDYEQFLELRRWGRGD